MPFNEWHSHDLKECFNCGDLDSCIKRESSTEYFKESLKVLTWPFQAIYWPCPMLQIISEVDHYTWLPPHHTFYKSWMSQNRETSLSWKIQRKTQSPVSVLLRRKAWIGPFQPQSFSDGHRSSSGLFSCLTLLSEAKLLSCHQRKSSWQDYKAFGANMAQDHPTQRDSGKYLTRSILL